MCNFRLSFHEFAVRFDTEFNSYFVEESQALDALERDGLLRRSEEGLEVPSPGKPFVRNLAMVFDAYLKKSGRDIQYSRTV